MRTLVIALIVLAIGIVVNFLMVTAILAAPCTEVPPVDTQEGSEEGEGVEAPQPAFANLETCDQARPAGFILLGAGNVFAAVLIVSELAKRR